MDHITLPIKNSELTKIGTSLKQGHLAIIPTDTQYGIVTSALKPSSVEKIYHLRKRSSQKPMIILISSISQIKALGIILNNQQKESMKSYWPNPVSIIIPVNLPPLNYLHRGKNSLAFRLPKNTWLQSLLNISGPLVAPSANFEGENPATTIKEAEVFFGKEVDFYIDAGELINPPSTVISLENNNLKIIRQGAYKIT